MTIDEAREIDDFRNYSKEYYFSENDYEALSEKYDKLKDEYDHLQAEYEDLLYDFNEQTDETQKLKEKLKGGKHGDSD